MITGAVTGNLDPQVQLLVRHPQGTWQPTNFVIDTGFSGFLALPQRLIHTLGLEAFDTEHVILSDGSVVETHLYEVIVDWDGQERAVSVNALESDPLIGTSLLFDHDVTIRFLNGGQVIIARTP